MAKLDFETLLRSSLSGVTERYRLASLDLNDQILELSSAIQKVTGLSLVLELERKREHASGTVFDLYLQPQEGGRKSEDVIASFLIPENGYPIEVGSSTDRSGKIDQPREIPDKAALLQYFEELSSNPDSPLVLRTAFLMRKAQPKVRT